MIRAHKVACLQYWNHYPLSGSVKEFRIQLTKEEITNLILRVTESVVCWCVCLHSSHNSCSIAFCSNKIYFLAIIGFYCYLLVNEKLFGRNFIDLYIVHIHVYIKYENYTYPIRYHLFLGKLVLWIFSK